MSLCSVHCVDQLIFYHAIKLDENNNLPMRIVLITFFHFLIINMLIYIHNYIFYDQNYLHLKEKPTKGKFLSPNYVLQTKKIERR